MTDTLIFFGNERLATGVTSPALVLQALLAAGYHIPVVVVAQSDTGKSRQERSLEVAAVAEAHGIEVIAPRKFADIQEQLQHHNASAGILVAYGKIVPQAIIDIFPKGIINIHPSLLPKHRGPTPLESAILSNDKETGVSLMSLAADMDAGPVYAQETILLNGSESKQQLADQLLEIGANMLVQYLPDILSNKLTATPQDNSQATYDKKISKDAGRLDWNKPAEELVREVRAYAGWPKCRALLANMELIVTAAHALQGNGLPGSMWLEGREFGVFCNPGILAIDTLIPPGRKEMTGQAFLAGYKPI
ncbi:MAG TPA: methionyl-tRNA formyltransferase [Candidatus Saccharimonadales bacterium]|nr:methionyl-tRNA formyltransferase [Candidatus Saccharimonadales bacterium]